MQQAQTAIRSGDKNESRRLLLQAVRQYPKSEAAWLWLSALVDDPNKERDCLERVLSINPNNEIAQRHLLELTKVKEPLPQKSPMPSASCPNCGQQIRESSTFCGHCGYNLKTNEPASTPAQPTSVAAQKPHRSKVPQLLAIIAIVLFISCCLLLTIPYIQSSISKTRATPTPTKSAVPALTNCQDCAEEGILISLWEHPAGNSSGRGKTVGKLPHNSKISILDQRFVSGEERFYYLVKGDSVQGWLQEPFVALSVPVVVYIYNEQGNWVSLLDNSSDDANVTVNALNGEPVQLINVKQLWTGVNWYQIQYKGQTGWVSQGHISLWRPDTN